MQKTFMQHDGGRSSDLVSSHLSSNEFPVRSEFDPAATLENIKIICALCPLLGKDVLEA